MTCGSGKWYVISLGTAEYREPYSAYMLCTNWAPAGARDSYRAIHHCSNAYTRLELEIVKPVPRYEGLIDVAKMAAPIVFGQLSYVLMQFIDQIMVARLGTTALAATGPAGLWFFICSTFFLGISACVSTFAAQSLGRGQKEQGASYAWQGVYIGFLGGLFGMGVWPLADDLFGLMGHTAEVTRLEVQYFRIRMLGFVFLCWQASLTSFFQAVNRPGVPMYTAWLANLINVTLNYLLIFGKFGFPRLEVAGAAWATVFAMGVQVAVLQAVFLSKSFDREFETRSRYAF
ncbi:MAG: MATE family efflux transporter, partial [Candidatus Hydrogenedentes bacterium]|nr:MATE family efflux transporter [Candidatus Hydrogenedentota bacterium]